LRSLPSSSAAFPAPVAAGRRRFGLCWLILFGAFVAGHTTPASAQNETVLILSHANSMWSKMGGSQKIKLVRGALAPLLRAQEGKIDLGIVTFGANKPKSCDAVDTIKPIGPVEAAADIKTVEQANPKGSASVAASLTAAAKLFKTQTGAQTIILMSDSMDECKADPCALAAELKEKSPRTIIHFIALGEKSEETLGELACIPEQTGGIFVSAETEDELNDALKKTFQLAALGVSEDPDGTALPAIAPPGAAGPGGPAEKPTSTEPGTLALSAILAKDSQPLTGGLIWRIYDGRVHDDGSYRLLQTLREPRLTTTLPGGEYLVNAAYGRANVTKRLTVWPDKRLDDVFNLNAGGLRLYATLAKQPLLSEQSLTFDVYSEESDQFGNRRKVIAGAKSGVVMRLNGGTYRVESTYGDSNAVIEAEVTVEPGKLTEATIDHQAGKVTFRLVQKPGGEALADTIWNIFSGDGQLVKKSGGAFPSHVLAAGSYEVRVQHAQKEFAASFTVAAGDKKQVEVVMP
jgi:von Willebrand factor type A domain